MARFHVSQDDTGYFQLTYENDQGELTLVSHQFDTPTQLIEDAVKMAQTGEFAGALVVIDPVRRAHRQVAAAARGPSDYRRPAPRKAGQ
jgi:hypothetical protein